MNLKHKVRINVTGRSGTKEMVLSGGETKIHSRLLDRLLGKNNCVFPWDDEGEKRSGGKSPGPDEGSAVDVHCPHGDQVEDSEEQPAQGFRSRHRGGEEAERRALHGRPRPQAAPPREGVGCVRVRGSRTGNDTSYAGRHAGRLSGNSIHISICYRLVIKHLYLNHAHLVLMNVNVNADIMLIIFKKMLTTQEIIPYICNANVCDK